SAAIDSEQGRPWAGMLPLPGASAPAEGRRVEVQPAERLVEAGAGHAEVLRSARHVAFRRRERAGEAAALRRGARRVLRLAEAHVLGTDLLALRLPGDRASGGQGVLELADVPQPAALEEELDQTDRRLETLRLEEVRDQPRHVLASLRQRWQAD